MYFVMATNSLKAKNTAHKARAHLGDHERRGFVAGAGAGLVVGRAALAGSRGGGGVAIAAGVVVVAVVVRLGQQAVVVVVFGVVVANRVCQRAKRGFVISTACIHNKTRKSKPPLTACSPRR